MLIKSSNSDTIRINLLLSSLYLTAFELLKLAIIEGTKDFFVDQDEITVDQEQLMRGSLQDILVDRIIEGYEEQISRYKNEVGVRLNDRDRFGLISSCQWLQKKGVMSEKDIEDVKAFRDHRNEIAHELPNLLVCEGFDVNKDHFQRMRILIQNIDVFWARNDLLIDPTTGEEVDIYDFSDKEILSTRVMMLDLIIQTVLDYLNEISQTKSSAQSERGVRGNQRKCTHE